MTDKKLSNDRCKAKRPLNKKTVKGANNGKQYKKYRIPKGPVKVTILGGE